MAFEVDEIERGVRSRNPAPGLNAPVRRQTRALRKLEIGGRSDEQRLPGQLVEPDPVIFAKIPHFAAEQESRPEGRHDAELVAQVWGEDLRIEGVVVEHLGGVDDLVGIVAEFQPGPGRRLGVLVDHLVAGSKEARIADAVRRGPGGPDTLVVGHPYVDIWQAVKPQRLGLKAWPDVPRHIEWKHGACKALGLPHADQADIARAWRRIRSRVRDWNDLEPALIGRIEELIDFVTQPGS